jgi:hypothetical protein
MTFAAIQEYYLKSSLTGSMIEFLQPILDSPKEERIKLLSHGDCARTLEFHQDDSTLQLLNSDQGGNLILEELGKRLKRTQNLKVTITGSFITNNITGREIQQKL